MALKNKKGKDDSSEKKRPAEEGASGRPPVCTGCIIVLHSVN